MADADQREIAQLGPRLTEAQIRSAAHVDQHSCLAADPQHIARRRPLPVDGGAAGPKDLHRRRPRRAALRRCGGGEGEGDYAADEEGLERLDHECTSQWHVSTLSERSASDASTNLYHEIVPEAHQRGQVKSDGGLHITI